MSADRREMEFKMERAGLLQEGDKIRVTEGVLRGSFYYTIDPSIAMSANIPVQERLMTREGYVARIRENERGFYVTCIFEDTAPSQPL